MRPAGSPPTSVSRDLHPTDGARFLLERDHEDGAAAVYRIAIYTPQATHEARATLGDDGSVSLAPTGAPDELHEAVEKLAKLIARDAAKRRADGLPAWPARILRWRR